MTDTAADPASLDLTTEEYRIYTYTNGRTFRINEPYKLYIMPGGSHRVVDVDGITHRPTPDWLAISWKPKAGAPEFVA